MTEEENKWPDLLDGEIEITYSTDECYRNVHPALISDGVVSSSAFMPTPRDEGQLSTARSTKVSAEKHYKEFSQSGHESAGVYAIKTEDIRDEELRWVDNESVQPESVYMTGHAYIDYRLYSKKVQKRKARSLAHKAVRVYPDQDEEGEKGAE